MIAYLDLIEWGVTALLALAASLIALRAFKVAPIWAVVIGIAVFTGLQFPITSHAVRLDMPANTPGKQTAAAKGGTLTYTGTDVSCAQVKATIRKLGWKSESKAYRVKCRDEAPAKQDGPNKSTYPLEP